MPVNPISVHEELRAAYLRYFDTAFWLRDPRLMAERRRLLEESSLLFTDPLLEPVLPYDATEPLGEVCKQASISATTGEIVGRALFGAFTPPGSPVLLRTHQAETVRRTFQPGTHDRRNVIVTSGTGSGKTESFLLPVLLRLVEESGSWEPQPDAAPDGPAATRCAPHRRGRRAEQAVVWQVHRQHTGRGHDACERKGREGP